MDSKRIKILIVVSLMVMEGFVWTITSPISAWSLGIIGGADGPEKIIISDKGTEDRNTQKDNEDLENPPKEDRPPGDEPAQTENEKTRKALIQEAKEKGLLILVNKQHTVDRNYKPEDLKEIRYYAPDRSASSRYMRAEAADAFHKLVEAAALENMELVMTTAYRSYDFQKTLFDNYVAKEGEEAANRYSAKPGQSEHQTGLSVDVTSASVGYQLTDKFGETKEGIWLAEHAHLFGFIIRFPEGKEAITGYLYEPWHIRYVGVEAATEIYEQGLTLEEYLDQQSE
ncbi:M15 family metallopeptidase [Clostridiales bacterium BAD-6]|uniref:M15 family metallopeptidase n=2 Tax=Sinanaerobacter chloroacetimidivorans TaxID=2818044 RepID=A0A8J7VZP9_9FIRM|nr:M15 family metallopeptidase [Sinanaerobacter chloroacetimidivorans]MBR0598094.1 M15 family metallopeptidase [Sinanaerobacter chloroacetimidivorans]